MLQCKDDTIYHKSHEIITLHPLCINQSSYNHHLHLPSLSVSLCVCLSSPLQSRISVALPLLHHTTAHSCAALVESSAAQPTALTLEDAAVRRAAVHSYKAQREQRTRPRQPPRSLHECSEPPELTRRLRLRSHRRFTASRSGVSEARTRQRRALRQGKGNQK
jgi:hypothetical protein